MYPNVRQGLALVTRLVSGLRPAGRPTASAKPRRRVAPQLDALETRELLLFGVKATITPAPIFPPTDRFVPVTISGQFLEFDISGKKSVARKLPGPKKANFQVIDEYRRDEPFGPIALVDQGGGVYSFSVTTHLQASRSTEFPAGRRYDIIVAAHDSDGWGGKTLHVQVPISLQERGQPPIPSQTAQRAASKGHGRR